MTELRPIGTDPRLFLSRAGVEALAKDVADEYERTKDGDRLMEGAKAMLDAYHAGLTT